MHTADRMLNAVLLSAVLEPLKHLICTLVRWKHRIPMVYDRPLAYGHGYPFHELVSSPVDRG